MRDRTGSYPVQQRQLYSSLLSAAQRQELERFGRRFNRLGANFSLFHSEGGIILHCESDGFCSSKKRLAELGCRVLASKDRHSTDNKRPNVQRFSGENSVLAGPLVLSRDMREHPGEWAVALVELGDSTTSFMSDSRSVAGPATDRQDHALTLEEMLGALLDCFQSVASVQEQMDEIGNELARVYEELVLLHKLSTNMKVTESDANFLQMACDSLTEVVSVAGIALLLERPGEEGREMMVVAGSGLIDVDPEFSATLCTRMTEEIAAGQEALLDSRAFDGFRYEWPGAIENIIAVPLLGKECHESFLMFSGQRNRQPVGVMVAVNVRDKQEFDSTDVKLFNSVANSCAVFIENGRLFNDVSELFVGSLRALTRSIDAKDNYTHGHSERVAIVSRWIAQHCASAYDIKPEQIHQVYLAGLLHDIGKIGVEDSILRKEGRLTAEEHECIRKHPAIGASILRGIPQMDAIIPGVLYHHEWVNGQGYPHGMKGDRIPLVGRIVGLADAFDAMTTRRSYRNALSVEEALVEIRSCMGTQFDECIAQLFLESDVPKLWGILQCGSHEPHPASGLSEYGLAAVGTLIR